MVFPKSAFLTGIRLARFAIACTLLIASATAAPALKTRNVFFVMTDGLRWQEVFTGAEEQLISKEFGGVSNTNAVRKDFWRDTPEARREALLPFFWTELAKRGQVFGNQRKGSIARVTNGLNFSYPGYSEMLTGFADPRIDSNKKIPNANVTVLEWLHNKPPFRGKVAAFANWDVVPFIINTQRSGIPVWTGLEKVTDPRVNPRQAQLEELVAEMTSLWSEMTFDVFIQQAALHHIRTAKPRVIYITYDETDEWAHEGRYDLYLKSAHGVDRYLRQLWELAQSLSEYRDQTTLIVTTDHGRGSGNLSWKNHGKNIPEAGAIWIAALGPDTPALGERENVPTVTQSQIAATVAALLGENYKAAVPQSGETIQDMLPRR
jgi:hypothetical protein